MKVRIDIECDGKAAHYTVKRRGFTPYTASFSMEDAKGLGLLGKDNWNKQPKTMRKWRAMSDALRTEFSDILSGLYTPEELGAVVNETGEVVETFTALPEFSNEEPQVERESAPAQSEQAQSERRGAITEKQRKWLYAVAKNEGNYSDEGLKRLVQGFGYESTADIDRADINRIIELAKNKAEAQRYNVHPDQEALPLDDEEVETHETRE